MEELLDRLKELKKDETLTPEERHIIEGVYELLSDRE